MANLLSETLSVIADAKLRVNDILWIGSLDGRYRCSWDEFAVMANQQYDHGFGAQKVASDLVIVFKDGSYLDRHEYDGSECWVLRSAPVASADLPLKIHRLFVTENEVGWRTVAQMNEGGC